MKCFHIKTENILHSQSNTELRTMKRYYYKMYKDYVYISNHQISEQTYVVN